MIWGRPSFDCFVCFCCCFVFVFFILFVSCYLVPAGLLLHLLARESWFGEGVWLWLVVFYLLVVSIVCLFRLFCLFGLFVCLVLYGPAPPLGEEDHDLGRESSLWEAQCQRAKRRRSTHWYYSIIIQPNCTYTERILNKHPKFKNLNLLHMNLSFREITEEDLWWSLLQDRGSTVPLSQIEVSLSFFLHITISFLSMKRMWGIVFNLNQWSLPCHTALLTLTLAFFLDTCSNRKGSSTTYIIRQSGKIIYCFLLLHSKINVHILAMHIFTYK